MRHEINGFNHRELLLLDLDCVDSLIISSINYFSGTGRMRRITVAGEEYFWVSHTWIMDELPIIKISTKKAVSARMSKYVECGLMKKYVEHNNMTYYRFNDEMLYRLRDSSNNTITQTSPLSPKTTTPVAQNDHPLVVELPPKDPNTNIKENNNQKEEPSEEPQSVEKEINPLYRECSDLLKKRVLETRQMKITEDTLLKWDNAVRLMVQRDHSEEHPRTLEGIKILINECHDMPPDPRTGFTWAKNILSMETLRIRWNEGKIFVGMNRGRRTGAVNGSRIIPNPEPVSRII